MALLNGVDLVTRHPALLPGVPLIDSPFFRDILAVDYFTEWEKTIALDLHHKGYAILDFPDVDIVDRAQRICQVLVPFFAAARQGGETFDGRLRSPRFQDAFDINADVAAIATNPTTRALLSKMNGERLPLLIPKENQHDA